MFLLALKPRKLGQHRHLRLTDTGRKIGFQALEASQLLEYKMFYGNNGHGQTSGKGYLDAPHLEFMNHSQWMDMDGDQLRFGGRNTMLMTIEPLVRIESCLALT